MSALAEFVMNNKTILFGGSFDPVHLGHIKVAQAAMKSLVAEKTILIPASRSPLKDSAPRACAEDRLEMLRLAVKDQTDFEISDCELTRPEPSYTIDTVKHFRQRLKKQTMLYWLIGADMTALLSRWHKISELTELCRIAIMRRGGFENPEFDDIHKKIGDVKFRQLLGDMIETPEIAISSSMIRAKIAAGQNWQEYLCPAVADYITAKSLYM